MNTHPIFNNMDEIQITRVIDAMIKIEVPKGSICSQQGKVGRSFYSIEKGEFSLKSITHGNQEILGKLTAGDSFGEIFIFDTPRMNTIVAETDGVLWTIERTTFRRTLEIYERLRIKERINFLRQLSVFSTLTQNELTRLAETCVNMYYEAGETVVKKGEEITDQSHFYIVYKGEVEIENDGIENTVLKSGQYFGERAFIASIFYIINIDEPRAKDVKAKSDCTLIALDKESFIKLLGPIESILNRSVEAYGTVILKEIPLLSFLTQAERDEIYKNRKEKTYKKGDTIYKKNGDVNELHIILNGQVIRSYLHKQEKRLRLYFIFLYF